MRRGDGPPDTRHFTFPGLITIDDGSMSRWVTTPQRHTTLTNVWLNQLSVKPESIHPDPIFRLLAIDYLGGILTYKITRPCQAAANG